MQTNGSKPIVTPADEQRIMAARGRWERAAHAMQSGVAIDMERGRTDGQTADTDPKHLRVGVNVALRDLGSLTGLLIKKGLITDVEFFEAIADGMEQEKHEYEQRLGVGLA